MLKPLAWERCAAAVQISYVDTVPYLQPEVRVAGSDMHLRTFVYHQFLLG